jgi:hypothetical protein
MISLGLRVWDKTESSALGKVCARLNAGIMTEISGWLFGVTINTLCPCLYVKPALGAVPFVDVQNSIGIFCFIFRGYVNNDTNHHGKKNKYKE